MSMLPIVNEQDEIIGYKDRAEITTQDIYRVSALWVTNSKGDILLAQRGLQEAHDPGKWGPAVAGTVEKDESYLDNILKEAEEEIGIKDIEFKAAVKRRHTDLYNYFTQWYTVVIDKPAKDFQIQKEELEGVRWYAREELARELHEHPEQYLHLGWALEEL